MKQSGTARVVAQHSVAVSQLANDYDSARTQECRSCAVAWGIAVTDLRWF